jgi:hypothetical protein
MASSYQSEQDLVSGVATTPTRARRSVHQKDTDTARKTADLPADQVLSIENHRPKRSVTKPESYAPVPISPESDNGTEHTQGGSARRSKRVGISSTDATPSRKRSAPDSVESRDGDSQPETSQKKSLKIILTIPRQKAKSLRQPSKLRFSVSAQEATEESEAENLPAVQEPPRKRAKVDQKTRNSPLQQHSGHSQKAAGKPSKLPAQPLPKTAEKPEKLSRRAQAKAEARKMGEFRHAALPTAQNSHEYPGTPMFQSFYAPSVRLMSPAMSCNLLCLDPSARILAFAQIAAESKDSDEEESSVDGQASQLYEKWLEKGRPRFCVCGSASHDHAHHNGQEGSSKQEPPRAELAGAGPGILTENEDVAAAMPKAAVLPIAVPPVNSIMPKAQGRRVSALYNVLTSGSSSGSSVSNSAINHSHSHSPTSHSPGLDSSAGMREPPRQSMEIQNGERSYEERMRWDQQMLDRIRKEARDLSIAVTVGMTYNEIRSRIDARRESAGLPTIPSALSYLGSPANGIIAQSPGHPIGVEDSDDVIDPQVAGPAAVWQAPEDDDDPLLAIIGDVQRDEASARRASNKTRPRSQNQDLQNDLHVTNGLSGKAVESHGGQTAPPRKRRAITVSVDDSEVLNGGAPPKKRRAAVNGTTVNGLGSKIFLSSGKRPVAHTGASNVGEVGVVPAARAAGRTKGSEQQECVSSADGYGVGPGGRADDQTNGMEQQMNERPRYGYRHEYLDSLSR